MISVASRPSDKLVRFAAGINRGLSGGEAAKAAGYGAHVIGSPGQTLDRARTFGLILTVAEATAPIEAIRAACSLDDWADIAKKAVTDAKGGDAKARDWLSERVMGKVPQAFEADGEFVLRVEYAER